MVKLLRKEAADDWLSLSPDKMLRPRPPSAKGVVSKAPRQPLAALLSKLEEKVLAYSPACKKQQRPGTGGIRKNVWT